jgi:hypothetical protein
MFLTALPDAEEIAAKNQTKNIHNKRTHQLISPIVRMLGRARSTVTAVST